ncbi:MAG: strawberry notch C-terminal domain-containing protein [Thermodesulfobacteriota bacterium]|nr:strawberry notch C-terminal domain-containing protein [Thermodesulfobacteriota bacterium]
MPFLDEEQGLTSLRSAAATPSVEAPKLPSGWWDTPAEPASAESVDLPKFMSESDFDYQAGRQEHLARKKEAEAVEVERSLPGEIGASVVRGALVLAKLPVQVAKIVGADVLGSETVKKAAVPIIEGIEDIAESPDWKPSKWAGGEPIDLDRIISNPREVIGQITSQATNPRFWASQLPEGAMSMIPVIVGAWAPRAVAMARNLGTALEAAKVAGDTAKIVEIGKKLNRLSIIGMYGMAMAMEAGQAEEKVREYELKNPDKPIPWANRVISILGTGVVAGGLEALSFGRVFMGKYGGKVGLPEMIKQVFAGKEGGLIVRKILDSVATEGVTEGAQSFVENAFAKWGFDADQKLTEGIVESVLIGAALGGISGTFAGLNVRHKAVKEVAARIQETRRLSEEEYQSTLQAAEEGAARGEVVRQMRPPEEVEAPSPYTIRDLRERPRVEQEIPPGETPLVDEMGRPIRPTEEDARLREILAKPAWERTADEKLWADRYRRELDALGETITGKTPRPAPQRLIVPPAFGGPRPATPTPMGVAGAEAVAVATAPEAPNLNERVSQLIAAVEETGDPNAAQELNGILIANQKEIGDLFRVPEREIPGLKPIADRLESLIRQVEETGDPKAALELHGLLAANRDVLSGVVRREIAGRSGLPQAPMGVTGAEVAEAATKKPTPAPGATVAAPGAPPSPGATPPVAPEPITPPLTQGSNLGKEAIAITARGTEVKTQFAVVEADDLTVSHDDGLDENPDYPQELQPRDRTRAASKLQVAEIANNPNPRRLADNPMASDGAPIIGPDFLMESGNARTIALKRVYNNKGYEAQATKYKNWLIDHAQGFGLDPDVVRQAKAPILVRVRTEEVGPQDREQLVREFNERTTAPMSPVEQARSDAQAMLDSNILEIFVPNEDGEIMRATNAPFIRRFMSEVVGNAEMGAYYDPKGNINQAGIIRIRNAIFAAAYGDAAVLERLAESTSDAAKNITAALTMVAPRMAIAQRQVRDGQLYPLDLNDHLAEAASILQSLREQGIGIADYLAQGNMIEPVANLTRDLLKFFGDFGRSRKKIAATFNAYLDIVEAAGDPRQGVLVETGVSIPTREEVLQAAIQRMEASHGTGTAVSPDLQQGEAPSGEALGGLAGEEKPVGVEGPGLSAPAPKPKPLSAIGQKLATIREQFKDIDEDRARTVLRALPDASPTEAAIMAQDEELFSIVGRGSLSEAERRFIAEKLRQLQPGLPGLGGGGIFDIPPEPKPKLPPGIAPKPAKIDTVELAKMFYTSDLRGDINLSDLMKQVQQRRNIPPEWLQMPSYRKQVEEALELALVYANRSIVAGGETQKDVAGTLRKLIDLYNRQPALTSRTSTTIRNQAYSTPAPLAYLMDKVTGITKDSWVYEPTAGNGMLLIGANPKQTLANEIDPLRAEHLRSQGFDVVSKDAQSLVGKEGGPQENSVDVVVANPPFGSLDTPVDFDGYKISKLEHLITLDALKAMDDDGRAAFIIGGHSFAAPLGGAMDKLTNADRVFFNYLYSRYNVTHHINIDGKVYERMGTKFPIRLITIEGRKAQPDKAAAPYKIEQIEVAKTFGDVYKLLKGDIDARAEGTVAPGLSQEQPAGPRRPGGVYLSPGGEEGAGRGILPGGLEGEGPRPGQEGGEVGGPRRGAPGAGLPGAPSGGPVLPGGREAGGVNRYDQTIPGGVAGAHPGVSPRPKPGEQAGPSGPLLPGPGGRPSQPGRGVTGTEGPQPGRVPPKSIGSGTQVTLPDGTTVTIKEEQTPYTRSLKEEQAPYGEQTVEVVDTDGNVRRIPISQIQGVIDESGKEVKLSDEDRQSLKVFQKNQWVETNDGATGQVTKVRGWGDKMVLTVQGPEGAATVKPADVKNILEGPPAAKREKVATSKPAAEEINLQVPYKPTSKGPAMNTVAPRYMAEAVGNYLEKLQGEIGGLDEFVRGRLGYKTREEMFRVLGAEQIEGVALAIDAIERGTGGFVIGHQTGVGKGRMVAAIMRYAKNQGLVPIFLTENDGLYSAMYRDMQDINADLNPLIMASNPDRARIVDNDGNVIRELDKQAIKEAVKNRRLSAGHDAIFTTYHQMNSRTMTGKMKLLRALAPRSILILDESHKGAGDKSQTGAFLRGHMTGQVRGVVYSSATYAKRPDTMALYHRTELGNLNVDIDTVIDNLVMGGVPLQEWVAHQWALSGQMIRNELSFAGIDIPVEVDMENVTRDRQRSDDLTTGLREILRFSKAFSEWVADLNDDFQKEGEQAEPGFRGGISNTNFASVMHNKISQLLFCLRTDATIKEALTALRQGKKVVIGCYNTMEAFVKDMREAGTIKVGDELNMNFAQVVRKAADSVLIYRVDHGYGGQPETVRVRPEDLPPRLQAMWRNLVTLLESTTTDVPALPIDYIAKALVKEGFKVGEITGREHVLDWEQEGNILRRRSEKEKSDKNTPVNRFNSGEYDALIINSSGSSGISLHSGEKFKDQRPRHMILTQMSNEINEAVQLLGRIHRTGQVNLPSYMIKISSLPGEKRPLAVLQKKLSSLFANISAKGESAYSLDVNDIINQYGDQVIAEMFADDPSLNDRLSGVLDRVIDEDFINAGRDGRVRQIMQAYPDPGHLTKRATGWTSLQPVSVQEEVWSAIDAKYEELVEHLKQIGEYSLESEHLDLQAKTVSKSVLVAGSTQGKSELTSPTYFEAVEAKVQKKPMTKAEIEKRMHANLKGRKPQDLADEIKTKIQQEFDPWIKDRIALMRGAGTPQETVSRFEQGARRALEHTLRLLGEYQIGTALSYPMMNMAGVVYDIKYKPTAGSNPATPSNIKVSMAVDSTMRIYKTSMAGVAGTTRYKMSALEGWLGGSSTDPGWDAALPDKTFETRYLVTGNLLGNPLDTGQMTFFTRDDGKLATGFLMPLNFDLSGHPELQRVMLSQAQAATMLRREGAVVTSNYESVIRRTSTGGYLVEVPRSKAKGGKYFLNDDILARTQGDFYSARGRMVANVRNLEDANAIIDILYQLGVVFSADRATAERLFGDSLAGPTGVAEPPVPYTQLTSKHHAEEVKLAYGSEKAAKQVVQETARQVEIVHRRLQGIPSPGVPGVLAKYRSRIAQEYSKQGWVDLSGYQLEPGRESQQIAELFQVFRNPKMEIMHAIYTKNGVIVAHNAITSGQISHVKPKNIARHLFRLQETAKRLGADKVHILHNHPSGNTEMSMADRAMARVVREGFKTLGKTSKGQGVGGLGNLMGEFIVIDHGKFSYLYEYPGQGQHINYGDYRISSGLRQGRTEGAKIRTPSELAAFVSTLKYDSDKVVLIHLRSSNEINGWSVHNKSILNKPVKQVKQSLKQETKAFNAARVMIITEDEVAVNRLLSQEIKSAPAGGDSLASMVVDIANGRGRSLRGSAEFLWELSGHETGKMARAMWEPQAQYDRTEAEHVLADYDRKMLAPGKRTIWEKIKAAKTEVPESAKGFLERFYNEVVDRFAPMERAEEKLKKAGIVVGPGQSVANALSYMRGQEGRVRQALTGDHVYQSVMAPDENGRMAFTGEIEEVGASLDKRLEPIKKLAAKRGEEVPKVMHDLFNRLMVAQRDLELAGETGARAPGEIKGTRPEDSRAALDALKSIYGDDFKTLEAAARSVREWGDQTILQPLLQVGFIDQARYDEIKDRNEFYIPFKRLMEDIDDYIDANAAALGVKGRVIQQIKGSERAILDPLQMWIELAYKANYAFARNYVTQNIAVLGEYGDPDIKEVPAKYLPVDFAQKQEIDAALRPQLVKLAKALGIDVKVMGAMRGRRLGQFKKWLSQEVQAGGITSEVAKDIQVRFATFEATLAHEVGHGIDDAYGLVKLLIEQGTPEMKRELRRIADQRADSPSNSYKRYIRKKEEQVAEFVSRYIIDKRSVERLAPNALAKFEGYLRQNDKLKPLLNFKLSHQTGVLEAINRVWARSPLPPEPGTIPYYRDGKQLWLKVPPDIFQATQSMMPSEIGILLKVAKAPADLLRAGAVLTPEFALARNPFRDVIQAYLFSRFGFNPLKWFRDAFNLVAKDEDTLRYRREWEAGGGSLATLAQSMVAPEQITSETIIGKKKGMAYHVHPLSALRHASAYLENMTRFSIYKQGREKGLSHADAIHEARRTTLDFARHGGHPIVRYLNMIVPFWNASIQGADKLITELSGPNKWAVMRRMSLLTTASILLWTLARQDDRYKELEDWEKNYFWHIPLGKNGPMLRFPKPFEAGILFASMPERMLEWAVDKDAGGVKKALGAAWQALTPEFIPAIVRPIVEGSANYNWFTGRPIEDASLQNLPAELRAKPWTSELAKAVSRHAGPVVSPLVELSPVKVEHFVRSMTGGLGANYFFLGIDALLRKAGALEDIPQPTKDTIEKIWGVRAFFTKPPTGYRAKTVNDFFEAYQKSIQADQGWKLLWNAGSMDKLDKFLADNPEAMFARVAREQVDAMGKIKKERNAIYQSRVLSSEQKRAKLDALDEQIVNVARAGNALMDPEVAEALKMPSRFKTEAGSRKSLDLDGYYKMVVESVGDAYDAIQKDLPRIIRMDEAQRQRYLIKIIRQARDEYQPVLKKPEGVMKPYRFSSLLDKPTRKERAWQQVMGFRKINPGLITGYRLKPEEEKEVGHAPN